MRVKKWDEWVMRNSSEGLDSYICKHDSYICKHACHPLTYWILE